MKLDGKALTHVNHMKYFGNLTKEDKICDTMKKFDPEKSHKKFKSPWLPTMFL